jgi:hypothetical protein
MIPATIRNNNPGGMYPGKSSKKFGSTTYETLRSRDGTHKIATFPTKLHGAAAMFDLLDRAYAGMTVEAAVKKWCGDFYLATYLKVLDKRGSIPPSLELSKAFLRDHSRSIPLARAMAWQEAGQEYPLTEQEWLEAHTMAFAGGKVAPEFSPMNDVPSPKPETRTMEVAKTAGKVVGAVATGGGGAVAVTAQSTQTVAPTIPVPPAPDLSALTAWQSAVTTGKSLAVFAADHVVWIAAAAALYWVVCHWWPARQA